MIRACVPKMSPPKIVEVKENDKLVKKEDWGTAKEKEKIKSEVKNWISQLEQALSNYIDGKDNLEKIILYIIQWIDWQRMQENKIFNNNILLASRIARWEVLKDKYPIKY